MIRVTLGGDDLRELPARGYDHWFRLFWPRRETDFHLLAGGESALPAILGILRDLPRDAAGVAIIEIPDEADRRQVDAPEGFDVRWIARADTGDQPGSLALTAVRDFTPRNPHAAHPYIAGELRLAVEGRRHLVGAGVPKHRIDVTGYWRVGRAG